MTIRERTAEFAALVVAHPDERYICLAVAADRADLLVAGDALAKAGGPVSELLEMITAVIADGPPEFYGAAERLDRALAAWKAATG